MTVTKPLPGDLEPIETASRDEDLGAATRAPEVVGTPHLGQRRAVPQQVRGKGHPSR